ncbi:MAG: DUF885 domain-containing protein [Planctomycetes bacterium]|jgi:hypothetical protein|nr:DUF885 domain-containing protein [Planctomycetota bacterium]
MRCYAACVLALCAFAVAQDAPVAPPLADLRARIEGLGADLRDLGRRYDAPMSAERRLRLRTRLVREQTELWQLDFARLGNEARVDWHLLDTHVTRQLAQLDDDERRDQEVEELLPFAATITRLHEQRRQLQAGEPRAEAEMVSELAQRATAVQLALQQGRQRAKAPGLATRARMRLIGLRHSLRSWFEFRDGYDPEFGWWLRAPFAEATAALDRLAEALEQAAGPGDQSLQGHPIGEAALRTELGFEWIPYTPAELVAIAEREFAWCDAEQQAAAKLMGCKDWQQALEQVKQKHRAPGEQPALVKELAHEAIAFLEQRDLVTIPELAKECWRMGMMSREAQRTNPFFLGGETISVSFPTDAMAHIEKLQALRSNNEHFCRATVHHELIPGHWLQQYMQARHRTWREPFDTPFWLEGWALYWEMRLYELGFGKSPEDKIGMLYWRKHRCARIVFSLNFHLGRWSGPQCVDYLIQKVGHERAAAEGEVRRSLGGLYPPLYQAAYMLGGLQLRALHGELVGTGKWTEKAFHDTVLQQNSIPIALLRQALLGGEVARQQVPWRFADR